MGDITFFKKENLGIQSEWVYPHMSHLLIDWIQDADVGCKAWDYMVQFDQYLLNSCKGIGVPKGYLLTYVKRMIQDLLVHTYITMKSVEPMRDSTLRLWAVCCYGLVLKYHVDVGDEFKWFHFLYKAMSKRIDKSHFRTLEWRVYECLQFKIPRVEPEEVLNTLMVVRTPTWTAKKTGDVDFQGHNSV